jgi:hypothetical protein
VINRVKGIFGIGGEQPASVAPARLEPPPSPRSAQADAEGPPTTPHAPPNLPSPDGGDANASLASLTGVLDDLDERLDSARDSVSAQERSSRSMAPPEDPVFEVDRNWYGEGSASEVPKVDHRRLAAEMGIGEFVEDHGGPLAPARPTPLPAPEQASSADVFASLLAAEQGAGPVVLQTPPPELTDEMLSALAARVVAGLQPERLHDDVRTAVASAVEAIAATVRASVDAAVRDAVGEAVRQAVADDLPLALRVAVNDAVAKAVPAAVSEAITGAVGESMHDMVVETAERLVREEIARIRGHRRTQMTPTNADDIDERR